MVVFNELTLSEDKKSLIVECSIDELNIYSDMYIKSVLVEYYGNSIVPGTPSDKSILLYESDDASIRNLRLTLSADNEECGTKFGITDFNGGLFLITVDCDGTLGAGAGILPCGYDVYRDTAAVFDECLLYEVGMQNIAYITDKGECADMTSFNHFVTMWHTLRIASESGDFSMLSRLWKKFIRNYTVDGVSASVSVCGCNR